MLPFRIRGISAGTHPRLRACPAPGFIHLLQTLPARGRQAGREGAEAMLRGIARGPGKTESEALQASRAALRGVFTAPCHLCEPLGMVVIIINHLYPEKRSITQNLRLALVVFIPVADVGIAPEDGHFLARVAARIAIRLRQGLYDGPRTWRTAGMEQQAPFRQFFWQ